MRILIPTVQVPFIIGGAEIHVDNLCGQIRRRGHEVELLKIPFAYTPEKIIEDSLDFSCSLDLSQIGGFEIDRVIALQFPAYCVQHPDKVVWLIHQHRAVYDLYDPARANPQLVRLRDKIMETDSVHLSRARKLFTIAGNVSRRLDWYNGIRSLPLYHPPLGEEHFYAEDPYNYIFYPSRIENLKRQDLLVEAMALTRSPVVAVIAGEGGQKARIQGMVREKDLESKVRLMDFIGLESRPLLYKLYARCLGVFFGPRDEDYGYVTLEAMLSSKPVITCHDSGGPTEFITDGDNGFVVAPEPQAIAEKIDWLYDHRDKAGAMGRNGLRTYYRKEISWDNVLSHLLGD